MRIPVMSGIIRRRLLVNFRVDPEIAQRQLPTRFRPKLLDGAAMAGICLIRLEQIRPGHMPAFIGVGSENAAHRIAVRWTEDASEREGVYIPRRDTDSILNHLLGGKVFSGEHQYARFTVEDMGDRIEIDMKSGDDTCIHLKACTTDTLPESSAFASLDAASSFFEKGSIGFSARRHDDRLDGIRLDVHQWRVQPLEIQEVFSSYFSDLSRFPVGSVEFDCALLMRDVAHEWRSVAE
jgi:uncharacterized protein YqjF (DUF2071 family)